MAGAPAVGFPAALGTMILVADAHDLDTSAASPRTTVKAMAPHCMRAAAFFPTWVLIC